MFLFLAQAAEESVAVGITKYVAGPAGMLGVLWQIVKWLLEDRKTRVPKEAHEELQKQLTKVEERLAISEQKNETLQADVIEAIRGLEE